MLPVTYASQPQVKIAGTALPDSVVPLLVSCTVEQQLGLPAMCRLQFKDPGLDVVTTLKAEIGAKVEVSVPPLTREGLETLFGGEVVALEAAYDAAGTIAVIRAYDVSHRLHRGRPTKVFTQARDSDIVRDVARSAGVDVGSVDPTEGVHAELVQANATDWEFLAARAFAIGYDLSVADGKLSFRKPVRAAGAPAVGDLSSTDPLQLTAGGNLQEFFPRVTAAEQVAKVEVRGWDPKTKRKVVGSADAATTSATLPAKPADLAGRFGNRTAVVVDRRVASNGEAAVLAHAHAERIASSFADAEGLASGDPRLMPGAAVSVAHVGKGFEGKYTLTATRHSFGRDGYRTTFQARGRWDRSLLALADSVATNPGAGSGDGTGRFPGVVTALVTDLADPEQLGRVRVRFPWLDDGSEVWARALHPGGGKRRGLVLLPEVDDEVLVAFEQGDPNRPYVLGGLNNGEDKPYKSEWAGYHSGTGAVTRREWVSRVGHRVVFEDPPGDAAGGKVDVSFADDSASVTLERNKLTVKATGATIVVEQGKVTVKADRDVSVDAGGKLQLHGAEVDVTADRNLKLTAPRVSVNGQSGVEVKGSPIRLN